MQQGLVKQQTTWHYCEESIHLTPAYYQVESILIIGIIESIAFTLLFQLMTQTYLGASILANDEVQVYQLYVCNV